MASSSFFDWVAAYRHRPLGQRIPWLERHSTVELAAVPGSVLVLHLPSAGGSGPGQLVVAPDGDAAFITEDGTCWEFGGLPAAVENLHEGDDGIVQVFLSRPSSIHLTFQADQGTRFLALLQQIVSGTRYSEGAVDRSGGDMGLFGAKAASRDPVISFAAGQQPSPGTSIEDFLVSLALSVSPSSEIAREDVRAYSEASYATVLGIPDADTIIAWGPGRIETPQDGKPRSGTVVVTRNTMLAYWQPGRTSLIHTFQGDHSAVIGYQRTGDHSLNAQWEIAEYADNNGKFIVGNAPVSLTADLGKDGHANRRALTWFYTLVYLLNSSDGSQPPGPPPSGGLGSSGTKL